MSLPKRGYKAPMNVLGEQSSGYKAGTAAGTRIVAWHIILGVLVSLAAFGAFCAVADWVTDGGRGEARFDTTILLWMHAHQRTGLTQVARALAILGSPTVIVGVALCGAVVGVIMPRIRGAAWTFPLAIAGSGIIIETIKLFVHRARPDLFRPLLHETGYSFPSGHSLIAVVVYGLVGYFGLHLVHRRSGRAIVACTTVVVILMIGISRVYVGVHYPTDVLAGWSMGIPWLIVCLGLHEVMVRRFERAGEPVLANSPAPSRALAQRLT